MAIIWLIDGPAFPTHNELEARFRERVDQACARIHAFVGLDADGSRRAGLSVPSDPGEGITPAAGSRGTGMAMGDGVDAGRSSSPPVGPPSPIRKPPAPAPARRKTPDGDVKPVRGAASPAKGGAAAKPGGRAAPAKASPDTKARGRSPRRG